MVILGFGGRPPLSAKIQWPHLRRNERKRFLPFPPRYTFEGDRITHHIEVSWYQNWAGTDQIRLVKQRANRLTLSAGIALGQQPTGPRGSIVGTIRLVSRLCELPRDLRLLAKPEARGCVRD